MADNWIRVDVFTTTQGLEILTATLMNLGVTGFEVKDAADFQEFLEGKSGHWDYIDDSLMALKDAETTLTFYVAEGEQGEEQLAGLRQELDRLRRADAGGKWGRLECALTGVREEDWADSWKRYYKPTKVGEGLVICPSWEQYAPAGDEVVLRIDPGMAFGTGTHHSTRLCLELLQQRLPEKARVLDLGCGSGILSIAALLLGAEQATGIDIDQVAVRVAGENAALNGLADRCRFSRASGVGPQVEGPFDLIFANIVADVIIGYLPDVKRLLGPGGVFLTSGIIDTREEDVRRALAEHGLALRERRTQGGWVALACGVDGQGET